MALRKPNSIPALIEKLDFFQEGKEFRPVDVYKALDVDSNLVTSAIAAMLDRKDIIKVRKATYKKARPDWMKRISFTGAKHGNNARG